MSASPALTDTGNERSMAKASTRSSTTRMSSATLNSTPCLSNSDKSLRTLHFCMNLRKVDTTGHKGWSVGGVEFESSRVKISALRDARDAYHPPPCRFHVLTANAFTSCSNASSDKCSASVRCQKTLRHQHDISNDVPGTQPVNSMASFPLSDQNMDVNVDHKPPPPERAGEGDAWVEQVAWGTGKILLLIPWSTRCWCFHAACRLDDCNGLRRDSADARDTVELGVEHHH